MLKLCQPGQDPHAYMGARIDRTLAYKGVMQNAKIAGSPEANARQCGKVVNLSSQYRVGYKKLQQIAEVDYGILLSLEQAQRIQKIYLSTYPVFSTIGPSKSSWHRPRGTWKLSRAGVFASLASGVVT